MTEKIPCPKCGAEIEHEYYIEEYWLVEEHAFCKCGYALSWAYGQNLLIENLKENE